MNENNRNYSYAFHNACRHILHLLNNNFMVLKDNRGFIDLHVFGIFLIIITICFASVAGIGFSGHRLAVMTYDWFGSAMDYASSASSMYSQSLVLNKANAKSSFITAFSQMTNTSYSSGAFTPKANSPYPGKIVLKKFEAVYGYKTKGPGYIAEIEVPVIGTKVPFVGYQSIKVPMRYFAVGKNTDI